MPIHDFQPVNPLPISKDIPFGMSNIPTLPQTAHTSGRQPIEGSLQPHPENLEEFLVPGFRELDGAMKRYFSGLRVPTKDAYRFMRIKVAGGDKSLLIWKDDIKEGRARLPLAAISRENHRHNPERFSPAYHAMGVKYLNRAGSLAAKIFRPVPFLVDYTMIIWTERKRDMEYIIYQILTRFNPLAEFVMFDGKIQGAVQLQYDGAIDASDKEVGYDQNANIRYELNMTAEAWLPLPEKVLPTVLGRVQVVRERVGEILTASIGSSFGAGSAWSEPVQDPSQV